MTWTAFFAAKKQTMKIRSHWKWLTAVALVFVGGIIVSDWWICLPEGASANYVGRSSCLQCHQPQHRQWAGSHHDMAMDAATSETVLGDFQGAEMEHLGVTSKMFNEGDGYFVRTEGADGKMQTYQVGYVFGVAPLQQYLVAIDPSDDGQADGLPRLQVLPICWDTQRKEWFHLSPPDAKGQKIEPDDPLFWAHSAQNWNYVCAECHSTNVRNRFDDGTHTYHTTFSEIDVSCEACHGPGSVHVGLAEATSLFWDRKRGYGLARLKSRDSKIEIDACGQCHSRRQNISPGYRAGEDYYDYFQNQLIQPHLYYADGQVLDEVYVYGSFLQSKMYHKGVRCTDCHNPHTARLRHDTNRVCTSCHQHPAGKYDTPAHHHHPSGASGTSCVDCHMPATVYMEVDPRRDHSFRVPRPDLSVHLGTPNACTGCHLELDRTDDRDHGRPKNYADWMLAARGGDKEVKRELHRLDLWARDKVVQWYGPRPDGDHFAFTLDAAWRGDPSVQDDLAKLATDQKQAAIVRASAVAQLGQYEGREVRQALEKSLRDRDPQVRHMAVVQIEPFLQIRSSAERLARPMARMLYDPARLVRFEVAKVLSTLPDGRLNGKERRTRDALVVEYMAGLTATNDPVSANLALGIFHESSQIGGPDIKSAIAAYQTALRLGPHTTGPRTNLARLLDEAGRQDEATRLRKEELQLLARDVRHLPASVPPPMRAAVHFRYGLALFLDAQIQQSREELEKAHQLDPNHPYFLFVLAKLYEQLEESEKAKACAQRLLELRPSNSMYQLFSQEVMGE